MKTKTSLRAVSTLRGYDQYCRVNAQWRGSAGRSNYSSSDKELCHSYGEGGKERSNRRENYLRIYRGIRFTVFQNELKSRLNVDCQNLENNPVGMLLLYEYLYSLRPASCKRPLQGRLH
ncbi:hypothetical protein F8O53_14125 [Enterobacter sp. 63]